MDELRRNPMIAHLLDALDKGKDIGHYGRLTFATVGHHYLDRGELVEILSKGKGADEGDLRCLVHHAVTRGFHVPTWEQILEN
jgi:hypothetical protein